MSDHSGLKILCLDAGDARCMSQLYILLEYMNRLEYKMGKSLLPCDHFDLIAAVDTSSPIAVFLCLFRMSAEDAQEAFHGLYTAVFANENDSPETRAINLEEEIKRLLDLHSIPHTKRLSEFSSAITSKLTLCYSPTARMDSCNFFRTYRSGRQLTQDVTIIEAIKATWATLGVLPVVSIGPNGREEMVASAASGFANPIREVIKEAYHVFGADSKVSCLLNLGSGFRGILVVDDGGNMPLRSGVDCDRVARDVKQVLARFNVYYRLSVDQGLQGHGAYTAGFGTMKAHVNEYLGRDEPDNELNRCIAASLTEGTISLERIHGAKAQGLRSGHGLPPLSAYFVMRRKPMDAIIKALIEGDEFTQRMMVISGLGGSGKTQLVLKFARDFQESYGHMLFIDASSADSIEKALILRVRSMRVSHPPTTYEEALDILCNPEEESGKDWFIIFDNADNADIPLSNYIPSCEHGSILITTRNPALGHLAPDSHLELDSMDLDEAVEVLLSSAFPAIKSTSSLGLSQKSAAVQLPTNRDREAAITIANELGCLPIAIVQAGCYIKQNKVLHSYLESLRSNRLELLKRSTTVHRDRLKYAHAVYASFDIVLQATSSRAVGLLGILSFFHYSDFPKPLFAIAALSKFRCEHLELLDRPPDFNKTIEFLSEILCPTGAWRATDLDELLDELQRYSLVTLVPVHNIVTLRFHPLVHNWAQDRLTAEEQALHRAGAIRLFVCGVADHNDSGVWEYLKPHLTCFSSNTSELHVNDQAAIAYFLRGRQNSDVYKKICVHVHQEVEAFYGTQHLRTTQALLEVANAHYYAGDEAKMRSLEMEVIERREALLGRHHVETASARSNLARTLRSNGQYGEAESMQKEILQIYIHDLGLCHRETADIMMDLAKTYREVKQYAEEGALLSAAVAIRTKVIGSMSPKTLYSLDVLADCHYSRGQTVEEERVRKRALLLRQELHGEQHLSTVKSMKLLAGQYEDQGQYQEAETLRRAEVETRKRIQGDHHEDTLKAMAALADVYNKLTRYPEAEDLWREVVAGFRATRPKVDIFILGSLSRLSGACVDTKKYDEAEIYYKEVLSGLRVTAGDSDAQTLITMRNLGYLYFKIKRYKEAEELWREELESRRITQGGTHPDTLDTIYQLGESCFALERYEEAEKLWREELAGRQVAQGTTHADKLHTIYWIARVCLELNKYGECAELWRGIVKDQRATKGDTHANTLDAIYYLAKVHLKLGEYRVAEQLLKERLGVLNSTHGRAPEHHQNSLKLARTFHLLSQVYDAAAQHSEAIESVNEAVRLRRESLEADDPDLLESLALRNSIINDTQGQNYNIQSPLGQQDSNGALPEDLSAPDPGGDPTYSPLPSATTLGLASVRPRRPFSLRATLVNRPNSWSMF